MRLFPFILCLIGSLNHKQILDFFVPFNLGGIFIPHRGTDLYPKTKCHYLTSFLKIWIRAWPLKIRLGPGSWITYSWKSQMFLKCLKHLLPNPKWIHFSLKYFLSLSFFFFLQISRLLWYANVLPNISTSQPLKFLHRPQPMGKFAREIREATGWKSCQEPWLHWPQTNVDFVAIPVAALVKQLLENSQSWGSHSPWLKQ